MHIPADEKTVGESPRLTFRLFAPGQAQYLVSHVATCRGVRELSASEASSSRSSSSFAPPLATLASPSVSAAEGCLQCHKRYVYSWWVCRSKVNCKEGFVDTTNEIDGLACPRLWKAHTGKCSVDCLKKDRTKSRPITHARSLMSHQELHAEQHWHEKCLNETFGREVHNKWSTSPNLRDSRVERERTGSIYGLWRLLTLQIPNAISSGATNRWQLLVQRGEVHSHFCKGGDRWPHLWGR